EPIYQDINADTIGNDIRNHIYLPEGQWVDYFTAEEYAGNQVINNFKAPLWKLPVFIKRGAIIPVVPANNNVSEIDRGLRIIEFYPHASTTFKLYDDDGTTEAYRSGKSVETIITSGIAKSGEVLLAIEKTTGDFDGFQKNQATEFRVNLTQKPKKVVLKINGRKYKLQEVDSREKLESIDYGYYYEARPNLNQFATPGSEFTKVEIIKNPELIVKVKSLDITENALALGITGYRYETENSYLKQTGALSAPSNAQVKDANAKAYTLRPTWDAVANADYYEIDFQDVHYGLIQDTTLLFEGLKAERDYQFKIRAVNKDGFRSEEHTSE